METAGLRLGEESFVIGFPLTDQLGSDHKVTTGTISALSGSQGDSRLLQFSAPVQPGNSGGPLFNSHGEVVGVVVSTLSAWQSLRSGGPLPQNVNFAIKTDYLLVMLKMLGRTVGDSNKPMGGDLPSKVAAVRQSVGLVVAYP
jgi:S1-C subfamily serine protease